MVKSKRRNNALKPRVQTRRKRHFKKTIRRKRHSRSKSLRRRTGKRVRKTKRTQQVGAAAVAPPVPPVPPTKKSVLKNNFVLNIKAFLEKKRKTMAFFYVNEIIDHIK